MSQKIENILNLALDATPEERERSGELEVGYDPVSREWELIVKYSGALEAVREIAVSVTELMNGYAVVVIREERIDELAGFAEIEFIEKPKSLYFEAEAGRQVSCIDTVQFPPYSLSGRGTLVGIIDSGIDYANPAFRNEDGTTRIVSLWDQTLSGAPPAGYVSGTEYTREELDAALAETDEGERFRIVPSRDMSGHGTAVAGIAAGNGAGSAGQRWQRRRWWPNRGNMAKASFRSQLPGAVFTAFGWLLISFIFSIYLDIFTGFTSMYGSMTTIILIMLWLYLSMYIILLGGEVNALLEGVLKKKGRIADCP